MSTSITSFSSTVLSCCLSSCSMHMRPLTLDREIKDLVFMYKALFGFINVNINNYVSFVSHDRTRSSQSSKYILQILRCRTSTFQSSHYNRIVKPGTLYVKKLAWTKFVLPAPSNIYSNVDTQTFSALPTMWKWLAPGDR